eukprot:COSAG06_NODE_542_length_14469_cov_39.223591_7_plen_620_part_00
MQVRGGRWACGVGRNNLRFGARRPTTVASRSRLYHVQPASLSRSTARAAPGMYLAFHGGARRLIARQAILPPPPSSMLSLTGRALSTGPDDADEVEPVEPTDMRILRALRMHPDQYVAAEGFNKVWLLPACIANHASLGAIFAWSVLNQPLLRLNGVVAPSAADWSLGDINVTFSLVMGGFLWGAVFGSFHDRWGPRACCLIGAGAIGGGFGLASLAVATDNLLMLKAGGLIWGLAMGWAYVPPLANVIRWFPDKKGFASSAVVVGYGAGALIAAPVFYNMLKTFQTVPEYLGTTSEIELINREGRMFASTGEAGADAGSAITEVVVATAADIKAAGFMGIPEGVYVVGTGSTGGSETFGLMGLAYAGIIASTAYMHRLPRADTAAVLPAAESSVASTEEMTAATSSDEVAAAPPQPQPPSVTAPTSSFNVDPSVSIRTPQFWAMYAGFGLSISGAYGIISSGRLMLTECFGQTLPHIVTPANTAAFVGLMSVGNLGGRLFWANGSDLVAQRMGGDPFWGRKATFAAMWGLGPAAYLGTAYAISANAANPSAVSIVTDADSPLRLSLVPCLALPCLALPCLALPCLALPCLALPCLALPCLALPCLALPYLAACLSGIM